MTSLTGDYTISSFLGGLAATSGVAMSNLYEVQFLDLSDALRAEMKDMGFTTFYQPATAYAMLTLLCEEASLPGMQAMTASTTNVYMGEGQINYAHTKSYQDITLGWICDSNMLPVKFLNAWMRTIFPDAPGSTTKNGKGKRFASTQVGYPDDYTCGTVTITKAERDGSKTLGRVSGIYTLYDVWPYAIQSTPLSYGASTLLKVTASFYYRRWDFKPENITKSYITR